MRPSTVAVRAGCNRSQFGEHAEGLFLTSSFVFSSAAEAAARFAGEAEGFVYSRFGNPTVAIFEERLAALEGGERAIATASGMAAVLAVAMTFLRAGDRVVAGQELFGATIQLFSNVLARFGVETVFADPTDLPTFEAVLERTRPRLVFIETPTNPLTGIVDLTAVAERTRAIEALLVVDNCFATPVLQQPLKLGADLVIHSATKYLDGQGRVLGGAVVGAAALLEEVYRFLRVAGPSLSPFNAWVLLKGLETLPVRMAAHCQHAERVASFLAAHPRVVQVRYPGLPSHPHHARAHQQMRGFGGIIAFEVAGGRTAAWQVIDSVRLFSITANLGDAKSTITHPATTTHGRLSPEVRAAMGVGEGLIRLSIGLEDPDDLCDDLAAALACLAR
ncbi:MAG: O-succinylhomoserine sulfhydrylase [Hydrogenophilus sp.]|nr:O-succinylhomoserine sulfhydrylase [Hydrogenophilus sp.]